jgi:hypothetical protein
LSASGDCVRDQKPRSNATLNGEYAYGVTAYTPRVPAQVNADDWKVAPAQDNQDN